jgi:hypothetical protein
VSALESCFQSGWPPDEHLENRVLVGPSVISIIIGSTIFIENDLFKPRQPAAVLAERFRKRLDADAKASGPAQKVGATSVAGFPQA